MKSGKKCETRASAVRGCAADQEGVAARQRDTVGSRPAERQRRQTAARGQTDVVRAALSPLGSAADFESGPIMIIDGF